MRQSIQLQMLVKSENLIRGVRPMAIYGQHEAQREKVKALLDKHIVKPPEVVAGDSNRFVVTLCRISAGFLDSEDNLTGAFKHVRDAVGRWLGFKNDANERLRWKYQQQECPKKAYAIRITIDDDAEGDERSITVGDAPEWLGEITEGCDKPTKAAQDKGDVKGSKKRKATQAALAFRRVFIAYPWDLAADAADDDIVATELPAMANMEHPPTQVQVRIPKAHVDRMLRRFGMAVRGLGPGPGPKLVFERVEHDDPAMGGTCWLYLPLEAPTEKT